MSIADGHELLDKLENIDPALIAAADREPERQTRRRGWGVGTWIAVAACLCVLCLPLILKQAFAPSPRTGEGALAGAGGASHQVEGETKGADPEGVPETAKLKGEDGEGGADGSQDFTPGITVYHPGADDPNGWTKTYISQAYIDALPEGLSPGEMFSYNQADPEAPVLWNEYHRQGELFLNDTITYWKGILPDMEAEGYTTGPNVWTSYDVDSGLCHVQVKWESVSLEEGELESKHLVLLAGTEQLYPGSWTPEEERSYMQRCHETIITDHGIDFSVLGTAGTEKAISFWKDGYWFRVYGWETAAPEDMVKVLLWALDEFDPGLFPYEEGVSLVNLQERPDAFAGYYPTDSRFVCIADSALLELKGDEPWSLSMEYNYTDTPLVANWRVSKGLSQQGWAAGNSLGSLYDVTREMVEDSVAVEARDYQAAYGKAPDTVDFASQSLVFEWDGLYIELYYKPSPEAADRLWELIQYLQSDAVKTEKKIGDIVKLQPYLSSGGGAAPEPQSSPAAVDFAGKRGTGYAGASAADLYPYASAVPGLRTYVERYNAQTY